MKNRMLTITSNPNNILEVESYLKRLDFNAHLNPEKFADILISLTEAVNNAIIHGNKKDESKMVHIDLEEKESGVAFCVTDEGGGFNPSGIPDPTTQENLECCGGRGVHIMKALADEIAFTNCGRSVIMYFNLQNELV
jgi:serine/threonine-protein kinase RsbW